MEGCVSGWVRCERERGIRTVSAKPWLGQCQVQCTCGCWCYCGRLRGRVGVEATNRRCRAGSRGGVGTDRSGAMQGGCSSCLDSCTTGLYARCCGHWAAHLGSIRFLGFLDLVEEAHTGAHGKGQCFRARHSGTEARRVHGVLWCARGDAGSQAVPAEQGTQLEQGISAGAKCVSGQRGGGGERTETAVKRTAC